MASEAVPTATDKAIAWDTEEWDDDGFWAVSPNPARVTVPVDGTYHFQGYCAFGINATGTRQLWLEVNSTTTYNKVVVQAVPSSAVTAIFTGCDLALSAGDYVNLRARHSAGSSLDVSARLQARRVSV